MADPSDVVDSLYTRLVLRDMFGKVAPGSLVLVAAYMAFVSEATSPATTLLRLGEAPVGIWAALIPLGWLASFALQAAGEKLGLIRYYPKSVASQTEAYTQLVEFASTATPGERQARERFVLIREACGNAYLALLVSAPLLLVRFHQPRTLGLAALVLLAAFCLRWMHRRHVDRDKDWRDAVLNRHKTKASDDV